jgi:hypothetical protein
VLSCPGRYEEQAGHPAAGNTGKNLELLLERIGSRLALPGLVRAHITITNAWPGIEYKGKTRRSEASDREVTQADNIRRLHDELRHVTTLIVFCGAKAKLASHQLMALNLLRSAVQIAFVPHLGGRGLTNSIMSDVAGRPIVGAQVQRRCGRFSSLKLIQCENTAFRIEVVAGRLLLSRTPVRQYWRTYAGESF